MPMVWTDRSAAILQSLEARLGSHPEVQLLGLAAALLAALWLSWQILILLLRLGQRFSDASAARGLRKDSAPGYRIFVATPAGSGGGRLGKWLNTCLSTHLGAFNFGAPFRLAEASPVRGGTEPRTLRKVRRLMTQSDADMIVWSSREDKSETGFLIHSLSRGGGLSPDEARLATFALPGKYKALGGEMPKVAVYFLARALQPQLADPQSFRPEKTQELIGLLAAMLDGATTVSRPIRAELEAAYCASCVYVAEATGELEAIDHVISLREGHLQQLGSAGDPVLATQAHMDLGRALIARAEKQFDQRTVQSAIQHLSAVVEALRADPTIQRAQGASDALFKAQTMIENRKRFSVNFGS